MNVYEICSLQFPSHKFSQRSADAVGILLNKEVQKIYTVKSTVHAYLLLLLTSFQKCSSYITYTKLIIFVVMTYYIDGWYSWFIHELLFLYHRVKRRDQITCLSQ